MDICTPVLINGFYHPFAFWYKYKNRDSMYALFFASYCRFFLQEIKFHDILNNSSRWKKSFSLNAELQRNVGKIKNKIIMSSRAENLGAIFKGSN